MYIYVSICAYLSTIYVQQVCPLSNDTGSSAALQSPAARSLATGFVVRDLGYGTHRPAVAVRAFAVSSATRLNSAFTWAKPLLRHFPLLRGL